MFVVERQEFALFLARSFVLGALLAGVYLLLGFVRIPLLHGLPKVFGRIGLVLPDAAFCAVAAFLNILTVYVSNRGQVRISALLFEVLGFCIVYLPFGSFVEGLQGKTFRFLKRKILLPLFLIGKRILRRCVERAKEKRFRSKLKRYNKKIDRLLENAVLKSLEDGERTFFPEK
jgi:hypothetical protein